MASIEISISGHKYVLSGEESQQHLVEVSELVRRRVETIQKKQPGLQLHKAAMLVALDFASDHIKHIRKSRDVKSAVIGQAQRLLERVEGELERGA